MFATHARSVVSTVAPLSGRAPFRRSRAGAFARRARRRRSSSVRSSRVSLQTSPPFSRRRSSSSSPSSSFRGADVLPTLVAASPLVPQAASRAPPPPRARTSPSPRVSSRRAFAAPPPRVVSRGPRARARRLVALPRRAAPPPPPSSSPPPPPPSSGLEKRKNLKKALRALKARPRVAKKRAERKRATTTTFVCDVEARSAPISSFASHRTAFGRTTTDPLPGTYRLSPPRARQALDPREEEAVARLRCRGV